MIVVADTTPVNYLILIGEIELLPSIYQRVLIPPAVQRELQHERTPLRVRNWATRSPEWCEIAPSIATPVPHLAELDEGEREVILVALAVGVDTVLIDESEGRRAALSLDLKVTGTLAIVEKAAHRGLVDFRRTLLRLEQTNFRLSATIRKEFLRRNP